jgi:Domain of unknown function (DUF6916)
MSTNLTQDEFSRHVGTQFKVALAESELSLTLVEVKAYMPGENEQEGMERFSIFFDAPNDVPLPQQMYRLGHGQMSEFDIFLTPISGDDNRIRYEAVFNCYRKSEPPR